MTRLRVVLPRVPQFSLSKEMIEFALTLPITDKIRRELVLPPDEKRPNAWNRIIAKGLAQFNRETGIPEAMLIRMLLVMYFTGNLNGNGGRHESATVYEFDTDFEENDTDDFENSEDEYIDGDAFDSFPGA